MTQLLPIDRIDALLAQILDIPDTWGIFDVTKENNEVWISLRPKEMPLSDNLKTKVLRHLEICGSKSYLRLCYSNEEDLDKLPIYTTTGFCRPFITDVERMIGRTTDASICNLYGLTKEEFEKIKRECNTSLLA
jgi:hypothetical protein